MDKFNPVNDLETSGTMQPTGDRPAADPRPARDSDQPDNIIANSDPKCYICGRNTVELRPYTFGESKELTVISGTNVEVVDNPNYLLVLLCSTDRQLMTRNKKNNPLFSPRQLLDLSINLRTVSPINVK